MKLKCLFPFALLLLILTVGCKKENDVITLIPAPSPLDNVMVLNQFDTVTDLFGMLYVDKINDSLYAHAYTFIGGLGYTNYISLSTSDIPSLFIYMEVISDKGGQLLEGTFPVSTRMVPGRILYLRADYYPLGTQSDSVIRIDFNAGNMLVKDSLTNRIFRADFFSANMDTLLFHYDGPIYDVNIPFDTINGYYSWIPISSETAYSVADCQLENDADFGFCRFRNRCDAELQRTPGFSIDALYASLQRRAMMRESYTTLCILASAVHGEDIKSSD